MSPNVPFFSSFVVYYGVPAKRDLGCFFQNEHKNNFCKASHVLLSSLTVDYMGGKKLAFIRFFLFRRQERTPNSA